MKDHKFRRALVLFKQEPAGIIEEISKGYRFTYNDDFITKNVSISVSLPNKKKSYENNKLFSFFTGLLPEGWYLDIVSLKLKIDKNDLFGLLIATCTDTAGAVSIKELK